MKQPIDVEAIKRANPIAEVVSRYHIPLRPGGCALIGRCPFHNDQGRPNLHIYAATDSWYCYRCNSGGDVITFVERYAQTDFQGAVLILTGQRCDPSLPLPARQAPAPPAPEPPLDDEALHCLDVATTLYQHRLHRDVHAQAYLRERGLDLQRLSSCRVGYATGHDLVPYLKHCRLDAAAAMRAGLLTQDGRERLAGRITVPALDEARPVWLIGRSVPPIGQPPKYLGLCGRKTLLGWDNILWAEQVVLVESVFDYLYLQQLGVPALALCGTHVRPEHLHRLDSNTCIITLPHADAAGREATCRLAAQIGAERLLVVTLPHGCKDVAELAPRCTGSDLVRAAIADAIPYSEWQRHDTLSS